MQPVITSLLDTDLYKFTMWQAMLHRHPATQAEYTFVCRNTPAYPLAELLDEVDRELDALCALSLPSRASSPTSAACASSAPTSSTSCASSASSATSSPPAPRRRQGPRDRRQRPAGARDGVRDLRARDRQRALLPPLRPARGLGRGARAPRRQDRPAARVRRRSRSAVNPFEFFDFGVRRRFSGEWHREVLDDPQARGAAVLQGRLRRALRARPRPGADRHDGARVPADLPDARRAAARLPARRARGLGPGVPRRPRHRADRRGRHGRLPRRLRPLLRQAVRRPAPRFRRSVRLGREGAGPLREAAHRPEDQAPGLLRRARLREGVRALPALRRPHACSASASAPTSPTTWA